MSVQTWEYVVQRKYAIFDSDNGRGEDYTLILRKDVAGVDAFGLEVDKATFDRVKLGDKMYLNYTFSD